MMLSTRISLLCLATAIVPSVAVAQICGPAYTVQPQTVWEQQVEQRLRVVYDTEYVDKQIETRRLVPKTRIEKRQHTVSKPVVETSTVQERYTVRRPVTRREWIDRSYDETTYVTETAEREERYTTYRPVTETTYQTQNHVVQRPVTETQYQTQQYTTYKPVTTYQNATVDQGQYVAQQFYQPGDTRYGLRWLPRGYAGNMYGGGGYRRGGLGWVPYTSPGSTFAQLKYQPNPVQVAIPRTTMMPQVQQQQVPVQVTRMKSEVVQQQIPINRTFYQPVEQVRKIPYSVQRPVTRRVERKEPIDRTEYVDEVRVRPKTVSRTTYKLETVEKEVQVRYYETESVITTVKVPRRVARYEPYNVTRMVPRTVQSPVVLSYFDAYATPATLGQSSWMPNSSPEVVTYGDSRPVDSSDTPQQGVRKVEVADPDNENTLPPQEDPEDLQLNASDGGENGAE